MIHWCGHSQSTMEFFTRKFNERNCFHRLQYSLHIYQANIYFNQPILLTLLEASLSYILRHTKRVLYIINIFYKIILIILVIPFISHFFNSQRKKLFSYLFTTFFFVCWMHSIHIYWWDVSQDVGGEKKKIQNSKLCKVRGGAVKHFFCLRFSSPCLWRHWGLRRFSSERWARGNNGCDACYIQRILAYDMVCEISTQSDRRK